MELKNIVAASLLAGLTWARPAPLRRAVDCGFYTTAENSDTCESFAANWGVSVEDLELLNPGINCPKLDTNNEYCVIGTVTDEPVPTTTAATTMPATTNSVTTASNVAPSTTVTSSTSTSASSTTTKASTTTTAGNGIATPMPTQPGMVSNCNKFHYVAPGVSCSRVLSYQKISLVDFAKWNPTVKDDCSGLWTKVNVCVGVIGGTLAVSTAKPSTTTSAGNGIQTPQPTQSGMVTNCNKFHYVAAAVTCSQITSYEKISLGDLVKWNPSIGSDCRTMQAGTNVCVGLIGGNPTPTTTKPSTTTSAGNGLQTPQPTQPGMITNCKKFHYVSPGNTCQQIISYNKINLENFVRWNPSVGSDCRTMQGRVYVCVGI
jgi:hypothetical protein